MITLISRPNSEALMLLSWTKHTTYWQPPESYRKRLSSEEHEHSHNIKCKLMLFNVFVDVETRGIMNHSHWNHQVFSLASLYASIAEPGLFETRPYYIQTFMSKWNFVHNISSYFSLKSPICFCLFFTISVLFSCWCKLNII